MLALRNDGSILMPVDTAGRVLEVMLLLEKHWAVNRLSYPLALLSPVAYNTLEFAKSQLEWMNEQVAKEFENSREKDNPFSMRYAPCMAIAHCITHAFLICCSIMCTPMFSIIPEALRVHSSATVITVCTEPRVASTIDLQAWHVTCAVSDDMGKNSVR